MTKEGNNMKRRWEEENNGGREWRKGRKEGKKGSKREREKEKDRDRGKKTIRTMGIEIYVHIVGHHLWNFKQLQSDYFFLGTDA